MFGLPLDAVIIGYDGLDTNLLVLDALNGCIPPLLGRFLPCNRCVWVCLGGLRRVVVRLLCDAPGG